MTNRIANGDYVKSTESGIEQIDYIDELLQNTLLLLLHERGNYYPNKNYGSQLKTAKDACLPHMALDYARQAVSDLDGVFIKSASVNDSVIIFTVLLNNEERSVEITL